MPKAWHQKQGLTKIAVAPWPRASDRLRPGEKFKQVLAKALNLTLGGGSHMPEDAGRRGPLLGKTPTSKAANVVGYSYCCLPAEL